MGFKGKCTSINLFHQGLFLRAEKPGMAAAKSYSVDIFQWWIIFIHYWHHIHLFRIFFKHQDLLNFVSKQRHYKVKSLYVGLDNRKIILRCKIHFWFSEHHPGVKQWENKKFSTTGIQAFKITWLYYDCLNSTSRIVLLHHQMIENCILLIFSFKRLNPNDRSCRSMENYIK